MTPAHPGRSRSAAVALAALLAVLLAAGCSSAGEDAVVIDDDGTLPPEATATTATAAPPPTTGGTTPDLGPPTLTDASAITTAGVDAVEFGMTMAEAEVAAGSPLVLPDGADPDGCVTATFESGPAGLSLTFSGGVLERLDVTEGAVATRSGAGIGDTTQQLRDLFGDQVVDGADPDGDGQVLTFVPVDEGDLGTRIIFVIEDDRVVSLRAGTRPTVETGC